MKISSRNVLLGHSTLSYYVSALDAQTAREVWPFTFIDNNVVLTMTNQSVQNSGDYASAINNALPAAVSRIFGSSPLSMTSLEIAELTGKQHKNVLRDVDVLLETLSSDLSRGFKTSTYRDSSGKENRQFVLDRDSSYCLVAGYDANARMRIIKRWQELESVVASRDQFSRSSAANYPLLPEQRAESIVGSFLRIAEMSGSPKSLALQIAGSEATKLTGLPIDRLLNQSVAMDNVPDEDVYLEPTALGVSFGIDGAQGAKLNKMLEGVGWQTHVVNGRSKFWEPTSVGNPYCQRHAYTKNGHSGYNLKWCRKAVLEVLTNAGVLC